MLFRIKFKNGNEKPTSVHRTTQHLIEYWKCGGVTAVLPQTR